MINIIRLIFILHKSPDCCCGGSVGFVSAVRVLGCGGCGLCADVTSFPVADSRMVSGNMAAPVRPPT